MLPRIILSSTARGLMRSIKERATEAAVHARGLLVAMMKTILRQGRGKTRIQEDGPMKAFTTEHDFCTLRDADRRFYR